MNRLLKCFGCGYKFEMDIPEADIKPYSWFETSKLYHQNEEYERALVDVRDFSCPKCGKKGTIQAEYTKVNEKIIKVNDHENFILSLCYPWSFTPSKIQFRSGYQFYVAHFLSVGDYRKISDLDNRESVDKFIDNYPPFKKRMYFDKNLYLRKYLSERCNKDKKFRNKLLEYDGYKIEFEDKDPYLGVKYSQGGKTGKNVYGKLLMEYASKLGDEEEDKNI